MKNFATKINQTVPLMAVFTLPCQGNEVIGECISQIYTVSLSLVGIVAFVQIVWGGFMLLTAAGNTSKTGQAMDKIKNAILGIVLLFSSYLILKTINPDLVNFNFALNKITKEEGLAKRQDASSPNSPNKPPNEHLGSRELAVVELFSFKPDMVSLKKNPNLNFALRVFGTNAGVVKNCPGADEIDYGMKFDLFVLENEGATPKFFETSAGVSGGDVKRFVFGDGKRLPWNVSVPLAKLNISRGVKLAQVYAIFSCRSPNGNWEILSKSRQLPLTIAP